MRRDRALLASGFIAGVVLAAAAYIMGLGMAVSLIVLLGSTAVGRLIEYVYFERLLAFRTFEDFRAERIMHECIACGACCHLKVNLGKDDVQRIISHSREKGLNQVVIERTRSGAWLKRESGKCCFLRYSNDMPRCGIHAIRPVACRLYPLIPSGSRLKADPLCPGFNGDKGQTFKQFLRTQEIGADVRRVMGRI